MTTFRYLTANWVVPFVGAPLPNGVVILDDDQRVVDVLPALHPDLDGRELEHFDGVICPGFVNAHCHLELSYMVGLVDEGTGLPGFLRTVVTRRDERAELQQQAIRQADAAMWQNGIVAVGDISNNNASFAVKADSNIHYHTFVEVFAFTSGRVDTVLSDAKQAIESLRQMALSGTIVPHAPYSVHPDLWNRLQEGFSQADVLTIHNQETPSEDEMFLSGTGELIEVFQTLGIDMSGIRPTGLRSLRSYLGFLPTSANQLLVHNTCTTLDQVQWAMANHQKLFWCACPKANWYIERAISDVPMWIENEARVCLGTDSLASNHTLSILDEMKILSAHHPQISTIKLIEMATLNGALALRIDNKFGSLQKGKTPGINLITGVSDLTVALPSNAEVIKLA